MELLPPRSMPRLQLAKGVPPELKTLVVVPTLLTDEQQIAEQIGKEHGWSLHTRAQDDKKVIRARMAKASDEMSHWAEYDYVVVNRDLDRAFGEIRAILAAERLRRKRQPGLSAFVRGLQSKL